MNTMLCRRFSRFAASAAVFALVASLPVLAQDSNRRGRKYKSPPANARLEVNVVRSDDDKPIENAAVVFQLESEKGNMELKTNEDGKAVIDVLPLGAHVVVQVLARGYQTYGGDYKLDKPQQSIDVKLSRPGRQYSIYEKHDQAANSGKSAEGSKSGDDKGSDAKQGADPKNSDKKNDGSAKQSGSKSDQSQPQ